MEKEIGLIANWLEKKVSEAGGKGVILGLSGGIDSAVLAGIAKKAFPEDTLGLIMPCHSSSQDEKDARIVAEALGLKTLKVDLTETFNSLVGASDKDLLNPLARSNIKPRLRMTSLYYYGQNLGYLVIGGTNKSEFYTGYFTKHGDSGVDLLPLVKYSKREIYDMARALDIPGEIIDKVPSAGLWEGQSDEEEMGFSYEVLESYMNNEEVDPEYGKVIGRMNRVSEHKRNYPPMFK